MKGSQVYCIVHSLRLFLSLFPWMEFLFCMQIAQSGVTVSPSFSTPTQNIRCICRAKNTLLCRVRSTQTTVGPWYKLGTTGTRAFVRFVPFPSLFLSIPYSLLTLPFRVCVRESSRRGPAVKWILNATKLTWDGPSSSSSSFTRYTHTKPHSADMLVHTYRKGTPL